MIAPVAVALIVLALVLIAAFVWVVPARGQNWPADHTPLFAFNPNNADRSLSQSINARLLFRLAVALDLRARTIQIKRAYTAEVARLRQRRVDRQNELRRRRVLNGPSEFAVRRAMQRRLVSRLRELGVVGFA